MPESRRNFLAQFLGGVAASVLPLGAVKAVSSAASPEPAALPPPRSDTFSRRSPPCFLHIETDGTPHNTHFLDNDGNRLLYVDEMAVQFCRDGLPWVGLGLVIIDSGALLNPLQPGQLGLKTRYEPDRHGDCFPQIFTSTDLRLPFQVLHYVRSFDVQLSQAFVGAQIPVKLLQTPEEWGIEFIHCECGRWERRLKFDQADPQSQHHDWGPVGDFDTLDKPCPSCHRLRKPSQVVAAKTEHLAKIYLTPGSSHLVFSFDGLPPAPAVAGPVLPPGLDLRNRPRWLVEHFMLDPVAQLTPPPSFLNDVFLSEFKQLTTRV